MALKPYILVEFRTKNLVNLPFSICAICFDPKLQPCSALGKPFPWAISLGRAREAERPKQHHRFGVNGDGNGMEGKYK